MPRKYNYITIEGNIGAGKTTLCQMLAKDWNYDIVLEQFTDNPFLPLFYDNPARYAFQVELFFMTERYKQLQDHFANRNLFQQHTIADYFFIKTLLFAKKNLLNEENKLLNKLFKTLNAGLPTPDLLVYLHRPVSELQQYIEKRGRTMEQEIAISYLEKVQSAYFEFIKSDPDLPILVLDLEGTNFVENEAVYQKIKKLLENPPELNKTVYLTVKTFI